MSRDEETPIILGTVITVCCLVGCCIRYILFKKKNAQKETLIEEADDNDGNFFQQHSIHNYKTWFEENNDTDITGDKSAIDYNA